MIKRLALLATVLAAAACTGEATVKTSVSTGSTPTASAAASVTATASPAPVPRTGAPESLAVVNTYYSGRGVITTPSGGIRCEVGSESASCEIDRHDWTQPGISATTCARLTVGTYANRPAQVGTQCGGVVPGTARLGYGQAVQMGSTRCLVEEQGVTCVLTSTRQGFFVSRAVHSLAPDATALLTARETTSTDDSVVVFPKGFDATFRTPSKSFTCEFQSERVVCDVQDVLWKAPAGGPCEFDDVPLVELVGPAKGRAYTGCRSDSLGPDVPELPYGRTLVSGDTRCTSERTGLTCRNTATGHGFTAGKAAFRGF